MNADRLLAHYDQIADAPDAITRLRRFILDLAVRGKIVPQDPNDVPGADLLKGIAANKVQSARRGELPGFEAESGTAGRPPFQIPLSWVWTVLGTIGDWGSGSTPSRGNPDLYGGGITWLKSGELNDDRQLSGSEETVTQVALDKGTFRRNRPGDVLIAMYGATIGKVAILAESAVTNQAVFGCTPHAGIFSHYLYFYLLAQREQFRAASEGGAQPNISKAKIISTPFPLPPLAEQQRIVAKVDELMALCDQLEAARAEREATRDRLTAASLARLNAPDPETFRDDARFALDALPELTARPDQIKQLRQTILNLAVRGKLVPQDPNHEPASDLLKRIANRKLERKAKTDDSRIKLAPNPPMDALSFELPKSWTAQSFENLFLFIDYRGSTPPKTDSGVPLITAKNVRMGYLNREPREFISRATHSKWMTRGLPQLGDLFFTTEAPLANVCLNDLEEEFALAQRVICLQPYGEIDTKFVMFALMSDLMQAIIGEQATGLTAKGIKAAKLKPLPIPIPPLAEQRRIVAKVNELMALCDRREFGLHDVLVKRHALLVTVLAEVVGSDNANSDELNDAVDSETLDAVMVTA